MTIHELKREALRLDPATRAHLARELLDSLDALSETEIEQLRLEEAARRDAELDVGAAESSQASDVLARVRSRRR